MSMPDHELLELNALCHALIDGAITGTERARLEEVLAASHDARRFYVRTMALSACLFDYAGEMQGPVAGGVPSPNRNSSAVRRSPAQKGSFEAARSAPRIAPTR